MAEVRVMGIDLGIRKVALAVWEDGVLVSTEAYESKHPDRGQQLLECADIVWESIHHDPVDIVWIENTLVGNNIKYSLSLTQMMGAVLLRLAEMQQERDLGVYLVNNKTWKKDVVGNGNADKNTVKSFIQEMDSAYAVLCGSDQDRYDAACIGYYGVLVADLAGDLADL